VYISHGRIVRKPFKLVGWEVNISAPVGIVEVKPIANIYNDTSLMAKIAIVLICMFLHIT